MILIVIGSIRSARRHGRAGPAALASRQGKAIPWNHLLLHAALQCVRCRYFKGIDHF